MHSRPRKATSWAALVGGTLAISSCGQGVPSGETGPVEPGTSTPSAGEQTPPPARAKVDPALLAAARRGPVQALLTVRPEGGRETYPATKTAVLARAGSRVSVVHDYRNLATMLVQVPDEAALRTLAADPQVAGLQADEAHTVDGGPAGGSSFGPSAT